MSQVDEREVFWHVTQSQMIQLTCLRCGLQSWTKVGYPSGLEPFKQRHAECKKRKNIPDLT